MSVHFFIDRNTNNNNIIQLQSQKFGPIDSNNYRTTSLFTIASDTPAFATTNGKFLIFDNTADTSLVNLIISSIEDYPNNMTPRIRYYVYRGLKREDFMYINNGTQTVHPLNYAKDNKLELLVHLYANDSALTLAKIYYTGDPDYINNLMKSNGAQLKKGLKIGSFKKLDNYSPGFELAVDIREHEYLYDLAFAKTADHKITVSTGSGTAGNEPRNILAKREGIHAFMDPAVFWALQYSNGIIFDGMTHNANESQFFYDKFLNFFFTKDLFYLDLRNFCDYSLNFFQDQEVNGFNLSYNINSKNSDTAIYTNASYYTDYWPIKIFNHAAYGNNNFIILNIKFFDNNFQSPVLYIDYGIIPATCKWQNGFTNSSIAGEFEIVKKDEFRFRFSREIQLIIPCLTLTQGVVKLPWFNRVYYFDGEINNTSKFHKTPFDYLFGSITKERVGYVGYNQTSPYTGDAISLYKHRKVCVPRGRGFNTPLVVQTGIGISVNSVIFYAKVIGESKKVSSINPIQKNDSFNSVQENSYIIDANYKSKSQNYSKYEFGNLNILFQKAGSTLQLHLKKEDIYAIQQKINNAMSLTTPTNLMPSNFELRFVFDPFVGVQSGENFWYGNAIVKLRGLTQNGDEKVLENLDATSQLFINSSDWITYNSCNFSSFPGGIPTIIGDEIYHEFETSKLNEILKDICSLYYGKLSQNKLDTEDFNTVEDFISIWRKKYYGVYDKSSDEPKKEGEKGKFWAKKLAHFSPFEMAIPSAFQGFYIGEDDFEKFFENPNSSAKSIKQIKYLFSSANENSIGDNPSPYIIDTITNTNNSVFHNKIDVGHLLYGLDGLIRDYDNTHENFKKLSIENSNYLTGYIADFVPGAAESRLYANGHMDKFKDFYYPTSNDISRLYEITAPDADILSDVDAFGLFNCYLYFKENINHHKIAVYRGKKILTLDFIFEYYYDSNFNINDSYNFPIDSNYLYRWLNFCRGFDIDKKQHNPQLDPSYNNLYYQGFVEKDSSGKYQWVADVQLPGNLEHYSKALLRKRAEQFAHFWYQIKFDELAVARTLFFGTYYTHIDFVAPVQSVLSLAVNSYSEPIRFERVGFPSSLEENLCKYIETDVSCPSSFSTDSTELEYVLNRFLTKVKQEFLNEKTRNNY